MVSRIAVAVLVGVLAVGIGVLVVGELAGPAAPDDPDDRSVSPTTQPATWATTRPATRSSPAHPADTTTATPRPEGTTASPPTSTDATTATPPPGSSFDFDVESVEECGSACRVVNASLRNDGTAPATGVTVDVTIYAGDVRIWQTTEEVGRLSPGESYGSTHRIVFGLDDLVAIQRNGGYVTIEATVNHDGGSETITGRRKVA